MHKHKVENMKHIMHECTQPRSHIVSFIIHMIYYWQVQVGVKSSTASEKYVMHRINTIQTFKAFPSAKRRRATSGALTPQPLFWTSGRWFWFSTRCLSVERTKEHEQEPGHREWEREVGGGRPGLWPLPGGLWVVVLVYCLSALIFIKLWGQM